MHGCTGIAAGTPLRNDQFRKKCYHTYKLKTLMSDYFYKKFYIHSFVPFGENVLFGWLRNIYE